MSTDLTLAGVCARYDSADILQDISLDIPAGQSVALLGRNGAGKTSLLHCLFNMGPQWRGQVRVKGQDIAGWPTHSIARLGMALVPQGQGRFPTLTVAESLRLAEQNLNLALRLADRALLLGHGQLVYDGSARQLRQDAALLQRHLGL